ncbi:MAG TPA: 3-deoxy-7-phosphoheptulonate synthase [Bdellovibrionales bacterium]|nr:MAG: 3-deoxy-7-phosphoheptulonate synthase [Bdellovibrionales bacterium GWB1_52_6]OFZ04738.1 MAG: 3-deoxy-7-phosphoheptulonate synthase [Bdellovibrionales bacterium GWA1_52_35]OFZ35661.1 MAG: 3-deoxy-7-phosphoheptulonate synthase [Bdellovibrionales bacterium GWC1_52_8]HAR43533.1 3-deoxy-7-phosphoheptulonate synthase [Bdellovibrionales bacterium]HCM39551.1 3-deoxy-7-phosphoheptulonate synthase [Bdellovibrionales bacterium]
MLILFEKDYTKAQLEHVMEKVKATGCEPHLVHGLFKVTINIIGDDTRLDPEIFKSYEGVEDVIAVSKPFPLVGREFKPEDTVVRTHNVTFGPNHFVVIAGPCAVESEEQTLRIARAVKKAGAQILRGGAFKPRSSPYAFQGMGVEGLKILDIARKETGMPVITELLDVRDLDDICNYADIIQIGTRNMSNFSLLKEVGKTRKPVMLKRGMLATIDEWLMAAEYIYHEGNTQVILCERGIRSFDSKYTRNIVDLSAIPVIKHLSHLPISVDPSHATGRRDAVGPMTLAALAAGANSVMIDVHDDAESALCDGAQAITPHLFEGIMAGIRNLSKALGKELT